MQFSRPRWSLVGSRAVCLAAVVFLSALSVRVGFGAEALNDPYRILGKYYEAMGGLDKLKAERTRHFEATVSVYGLTGTVKEWDRVPSEKRQEVDLTVFKQTSGDNGEFPWVVDQNGKLQIQKDEPTLKKRRVEELVATFDHLNPNSKNFMLTFLNTEKVGDTDCYIVKLASTINEDYRLFYINTTNFYLEKLTLVDPTMEVRTVYSDYRDQGGIMIPFHQESEVLPIGQKQTVELTSYESNIEIDPVLFEPPKQDVKDYRFADGTSSEDIPIQYIGDHVFIEVTLNCDRKTWCLDTGASVTVIDSDYAKAIGLESSGSIKASGAGETVTASFVTLPPFSIEGITFDSQKVASIEVSGLFKKIGIDVAGVLGYDFLSRFVTRVDYANKKISFYDPDTFEYKGGGKIVDAALRDNLFTLPMSVDGKYAGTWTLLQLCGEEPASWSQWLRSPGRWGGRLFYHARHQVCQHGPGRLRPAEPDLLGAADQDRGRHGDEPGGRQHRQ
jgi:predicted aspartyl protease